IFDLIRGELKVTIFKSRVAQSVSKWVAYRHFLGVIVAVSHKDSLFVFYLLSVSREVQVRWIVGKFIGNGLSQFTAWVYFSKQDIYFRLSYSLSAEVCFQDSLYLVRPGHFHR